MIFHTKYVWRSLAAALAAIGLLPGQAIVSRADAPPASPVVQNVSWTTRSTVTDANWNPIPGQQESSPFKPDAIIWLRRSPPAIATREQPAGFTLLNDTRGTLQRRRQGDYLVRLIGSLEKRSFERSFAGDVEARIASITRPQSWKSTLPNHGAYIIVTNSPQRLATLNGQKQIVFAFDAETIVGKTSHFSGIHSFQHVSTWVNPVTHLVTRREARYWSDRMGGQFNQRFVVVADGFHYNQAPPPGVFDWSPPPGANVTLIRDLRADKRLSLTK